MQYKLGEVRRSQVVQTYGPGSIVDFRAGRGGEAAVSVVATGLETWEDVPHDVLESTRIFEPRLQKLLHVKFFRTAPVAPEKAPWDPKPQAVYLEGRRFPSWQQCPRCHSVAPFQHWKRTPGDAALACPTCTGDTVYALPVPFVMTCRRGHLDEFDWVWWAHKGAACDAPKLELKSRGGTGLASLILRCRTCNQQRDMDGAMAKATFRERRCRGRRPWLDDAEECPEHPVTVQRGASNLYFAKSFSSLDIPPWSDPIMRVLGVNWTVLSEAEESSRGIVFDALDALHRYTARLGLTARQILDAVASRKKLIDTTDPETLHREEHLRLLEPTSERGLGHEFETARHPVPGRIQSFVSHLIEVRKLREVRAITGFTRISPPGSEEGRDAVPLCKISRTPMEWLPAIEIRGEGLYLELDQQRIDSWLESQSQGLVTLTERMRRRYQAWWDGSGREGPAPDQPIEPTYLLVHTLAHALIRQLALDCGYSSASLRERLYVQTEGHRMHGLLIYTGSPDADGTLGGLSRQAHPNRVEQLVLEAVRSLAWCSNDPLCIHGEASSEPLNRAACHSCALVSETSCVTFNQLLDRAVLVGTPENRELGFFASLLERA